jgi:hypothetical protein
VRASRHPGVDGFGYEICELMRQLHVLLGNISHGVLNFVFVIGHCFLPGTKARQQIVERLAVPNIMREAKAWQQI